MKRSLALLALVLVLMAGTAGMASADTLTLTFDDGTGQTAGGAYIPPPGSPIASVINVNWSDDDVGHLYCNNVGYNSIISFTTSTYVNNFQMTGLPYARASVDADDYIFGPMNIAAFNADYEEVWSATVEFTASPHAEPYTDWGQWLTVVVDTDAVSKIIFYGPNPFFLEEGPFFTPSIDNLVIETAVIPIPASVWLLASGLLGLVGLRRKFTR